MNTLFYVGDVNADGRPDIVASGRNGRMAWFENGGESWTRQVIDEGIGVHHARLADFRGRGALDIASRSLHGPHKWNVYVWYNESDEGGIS